MSHAAPHRPPIPSTQSRPPLAQTLPVHPFFIPQPHAPPSVIFLATTTDLGVLGIWGFEGLNPHSPSFPTRLGVL